MVARLLRNRNKPVSPACYCFDVTGSGGRVSQGPAKSMYALVEAALEGHQDLSIGKQGCLVPNPCASHIANARESTRGGVEKLCRGKSSCSVRPSCYQDPSVGKPGCCMPSARELHASGRREAAGRGARDRKCQDRQQHGREKTQCSEFHFACLLCVRAWSRGAGFSRTTAKRNSKECAG